MMEKLKYCLGISTTRPVFVIGTGRSGTHWLGYSLKGHPEIRVTIEAQPMFRLSTRMALNPTLETKLFGRLKLVYQWQLFRSAPQLYLDKSHPNIWIAERLKAAFPQSLFLAIQRNPYATVSSMMKHESVSAWHKRWREFPLPNRFLGITNDLAPTYDSIPFPSQCAMRWVAHRDRLNELRKSLGDDLFVISYEMFAHHTEDVLRELQQFLGLNSSIPIPQIRTDSLQKCKTSLTVREIEEIQRIVGYPPDTIHYPEPPA